MTVDDATPSGGTGPRSGSARLSRRQFLLVAGAAAAGTATLGAMAWPGNTIEDLLSSHRLAPSSTGAAGDGPILVLLTLYGGNDGLNTVVPYEDPSYASARGAAALDPSTVLPLGEGFGLHPSLTGFEKLFHQKRLAVVHGVGYPDASLSHFESMDIWQSAVPDGAQNAGWLGRWLDSTGDDPLRAMAIGATLPLALVGDKVQGAAVPPPPLTLPGTGTQQAAFMSMEASTGRRSALLADAARSGADLMTVQRRLAPVLDSASPSASVGARNLEGASAGALAIAQGGGGRSTTSVLAQQLDLVARMIEAKVPTKVYAVSFGGFDTHTNEAATQQALLSQLDSAVSAFVAQVHGVSSSRPVVVLIHTEFGRRVAGNASGGTDHGTANVVLLAGSHVNGGFYGEAPNLQRLDENGNLVFTTDFRSVYSAVLQDVIGVDAARFLGGSFPPVPALA